MTRRERDMADYALRELDAYMEYAQVDELHRNKLLRAMSWLKQLIEMRKNQEEKRAAKA